MPRPATAISGDRMKDGGAGSGSYYETSRAYDFRLFVSLELVDIPPSA